MSIGSRSFQDRPSANETERPFSNARSLSATFVQPTRPSRGWRLRRRGAPGPRRVPKIHPSNNSPVKGA